MSISNRKPCRRRGATLVEFAIAAPVVFLLFFAGYEFSRVEMVRHSLDIAAYEGARRGIVSGATSGDVESRVRDMLASVSIENATIQVSPAAINNSTPEVTVDLTVPMDENGWVFPRFLGRGFTLQATSTLAREGFTNS